MPSGAAVLGFTHRWCAPAIEHAQGRRAGKLPVRLVCAPCFLAVKLEASDGRGWGDCRASHGPEEL